jgi:hypothetical protein
MIFLWTEMGLSKKRKIYTNMSDNLIKRWREATIKQLTSDGRLKFMRYLPLSDRRASTCAFEHRHQIKGDEIQIDYIMFKTKDGMECVGQFRLRKPTSQPETLTITHTTHVKQIPE